MQWITSLTWNYVYIIHESPKLMAFNVNAVDSFIFGIAVRRIET